MTIHSVLEICITISILLYIGSVMGAIGYMIMTYEFPHSNYVSDSMWEILCRQWARNEYDIKTYHKVARAKNKEYKRLGKTDKIIFVKE